MMTSIDAYLRQGRRLVRQWAVDDRVHGIAKGGGCFLGGFLLSAASLGNAFQPLALGGLLALEGWPAAMLALGGAVGYRWFWGTAGYQGAVWLALGLLAALTAGARRISRETPLLMPALAALIAAGTGVVFQIWLGDTTTVPIYLLRVVLGTACAWVIRKAIASKDPILTWLCWALGVLALAQVTVTPWLGFGYIAAGALGVAAPFPAAALAGLALDLAGVTKVPMTAVLCLAFFIRYLPKLPKWVLYTAPAAVYLLVAGLVNVWDLLPVPGLLIGGIAGAAIPWRPQKLQRRGEMGAAQVRLEMTAGVLSQAEQLLLEATEPPVDEAALVKKAAQRACAACPCRKSCKLQEDAQKMPAQLLHKPLLRTEDMGLDCRKPFRLMQELQRSQEQFRLIRADRQRQRDYRTAVIQQYGFLSEYLQILSDTLAERTAEKRQRYTPEVAVYANRREGDNGDRCLWFSGTGCKYYVLLCDGMGTGLGAVQEGKTAATMLRKLLTAGFPAEYALRSLNSLCALRDRAGAVTADLAEIFLDTGKVTLYKWGAAPSYLLYGDMAEKIGTAGPPPGLSLTEGRETVERLSLRRGETLLMVSDGVGGEEILRCQLGGVGQTAGELAARLIEDRDGSDTDDATVASIRLTPLPVVT